MRPRRRRQEPGLLALVLVVSTVLAGLAACSADDTSDRSPGDERVGSDRPSDEEVEVDIDSFPVTVEHMLGTAVVEEPPQRVVALGLAEQDIVLALGVTPVAMVGNPWSDDERFPWVGDEHDLTDVTFVPMETTLASAEQLVALRPDLVLALTASADEALYGQAVGRGVPIIAPLSGPMQDSWQDMTREIGRALGRSKRAEELIAEVEAQIGAVREDLPGLEGRTFVVAAAQAPAKLRAINRSTDTAARFFGELGMLVPAELEAMDNPTPVGAVDISTERIDLLDGDALFLSNVGDNRDALERQVAFNDLHSVRHGGYLPYDNDEAYGLRVPTPLSIPYLLERFRPTFEAVVEAPPAGNG